MDGPGTLALLTLLTLLTDATSVFLAGSGKREGQCTEILCIVVCIVVVYIARKRRRAQRNRGGHQRKKQGRCVAPSQHSERFPTRQQSTRVRVPSGPMFHLPRLQPTVPPHLDDKDPLTAPAVHCTHR
jgi:hypothetical protein